MTIIEDKTLSEVLSEKNSAKLMKPSEQVNIGSLKLKEYKKRWLILGIYIFCTVWSAFQWIEYSIIANIVMRYYGVSSLMVDWTSMSYMAFYSILTIPIAYATDKYGLRKTVIVASVLCCLGSWIKTFSIHPDRFYVAFIGQSIVAIGQTIFLPLPGRLSAQWFPSRELSTATSLGIFGSQLGIAISSLFTPMIVKNHGNLDNIGTDLTRLCWALAIATTIGLVLVLLLFQDEPKLPPSETRVLQKINRNKKEDEFIGPMRRLMKNKSYILLCNSHGLNVGVLNAVLTLLNHIFLAHFENGEEDAGRIGLAMIITGTAGSVSFGIFLDRTHKFKETAVTVYFLTLCGQILFSVSIYFSIMWMVYASSIFLGFFMSGYLALGYELCTEYTYPEAENITAGILNITNNVYGIIFVIILEILMKDYGDIPVHIGFLLVLLLGFILTILTKDEQRRQDAKKKSQFKELAGGIEKGNIDGVLEANPLAHDID